jgi:hypothetical protein
MIPEMRQKKPHLRHMEPLKNSQGSSGKSSRVADNNRVSSQGDPIVAGRMESFAVLWRENCRKRDIIKRKRGEMTGLWWALQRVFRANKRMLLSSSLQ